MKKLKKRTEVKAFLLGSMLLLTSLACNSGGGSSGASPGPGDTPTPTPTPSTPVSNPGCSPDPRCAKSSDGNFHAGRGPKDNPYLICTYKQLKDINELNDTDKAAWHPDRTLTDKYYVLGQDIDASASWSEGTGGCTPYDGANAKTASCNGWTPIGKDRTDFFRGSFEWERLYHFQTPRLCYCYWDCQRELYAGLFGYVGSDPGATATFINNVRIVDSNIRTSSTVQTTYTGGVVGYNHRGSSHQQFC